MPLAIVRLDLSGPTSLWEQQLDGAYPRCGRLCAPISSAVTTTSSPDPSERAPYETADGLGLGAPEALAQEW